MKNYTAIILVLGLAVSCGNSERETDAYGNFSATEILVTAQTSGTIVGKYIDDGMRVKNQQHAYIIDTIQTHLKKQELLARRKAVEAKKANTNAQLAVLDEQKRALETDQERFTKIVADGAVPQKQLDDITNKLNLVEKQMDQVRTSFATIRAELAAIDASKHQVDDMLRRAYVLTPISGTVLETYMEQGEAVAPGKPLFKIANLDTMELKAYFSSNQLAAVKLGEKAQVLVDDGQGGMKEFSGGVSWISPQAEFTPKVIQTQEERVSLVYAVKIKVVNDGTLRINMPGEVRLNISEE